MQDTLPQPVGSAADTLVKQGILGAIAVLLMFALAYMFVKWNRSQEARVDDQKAVTQTLLQFTGNMRDAFVELKHAVEAMTKATDDNRAVLQENKNAVSALSQRVEAAMAKVDAIHAGMVKMEVFAMKLDQVAQAADRVDRSMAELIRRQSTPSRYSQVPPRNGPAGG